MSQEPHPETDQTTPGTTPAQEPGAASELERQRAEGDRPGRSTRHPSAPSTGASAEAEDPEQRDDADAPSVDIAVPPSRTVPDEVAEQAARDVDPLTSGTDGGTEHRNPMRPATSTSDIEKDRPPAEDL